MIEFKHLEQVLTEYAKELEEKYKRNLESSGRKASGQLLTSINYNIVINDNEYAIDFNLEDYWKYVEEGRGAGKFPPVNKILEWIRIKPVLPYPDKNGKLPTEKQLAFLISRKIADEGFEGSHDLSDTLEEVDYETKIQDALDMDILGCIDELFLILE